LLDLGETIVQDEDKERKGSGKERVSKRMAGEGGMRHGQCDARPTVILSILVVVVVVVVVVSSSSSSSSSVNSERRSLTSKFSS